MSDKNMKLPVLAFGQAIAQKPSLEAIDLLLHRRSASPASLGLPGPTEAQMDIILNIALRVPDHGKLHPWRIVRFQPETKSALIETLRPLALMQTDPKKALAGLMKLAGPPVLLLVISSPVLPPKKPVWEQQLSAGAVCQNILIAAIALGFNGNWITEWVSYDDKAREVLGIRQDEQVAGLILIGTELEPPLERERPNIAQKISFWTAPNEQL